MTGVLTNLDNVLHVTYSHCYAALNALADWLGVAYCLARMAWVSELHAGARIFTKSTLVTVIFCVMCRLLKFRELK